MNIQPSSKSSSVIRVWIVEDNRCFRDAVRLELNENEEICCEAAFGSCEALLDELEKSAAPDVLLLDIGLPGLSGIDAISVIKAKVPEVQILMLTMFDDQDRIFKAVCAGASGYLLKDSAEDIPTAVRQVYEGGAVLSPSIARSVLNQFNRMNGPRVESDEYNLAARERSILELMVQGLIKKEIADRLSLSYHTVDSHLRKIYRKLHVNSGTSAVAKALREKLC